MVMHRSRSRATALLLPAASAAALCLGAAVARADVVYGTSADGTGIPFAAAGGTGMHYQQLYDGAAFGGSTAVLEGLRFDSFGSFTFSTLYSSIEVTLSTTNATLATLSSTFANNLGADATVVRSGSLALSSLGDAYDVAIDFDDSFVYDPSAGNLLLSLRVVGGNTSATLSAGNSSALGRVVSLAGAGVGSTSGVVSAGYGLATTWVVSSVPEPGTAASMLAGLALTAVWLHRRRRAG